MIKIGCISWSHRNDFKNGAMDIFSWIAHCKKDAKLDGVELWNNHFASIEPDYLAQIKAEAEKLDIPIYSVATKCLFGDFSSEQVEQAKQTLRDWLVVADTLNAPLLRVSVGGNELRDPARQLAVFDALTEVVRENKYPQIQVGIENQEPGVVQNTADVRLMTERSGGALKLVLDNGSLIHKEDSYAFTAENIGCACVVHVKFFDLETNGSDQVLDYQRISEIVKQSGYNGYLSIEYDSEAPAVRDVPRIAAYLHTLF